MLSASFRKPANLRRSLSLTAALLLGTGAAHANNHYIYPAPLPGIIQPGFAGGDLFSQILSSILVGALPVQGNNGIIGYDPYGDSLYGDIDDAGVIAYDRYGRPVFNYRASGTVLVGYDRYRRPVYGYPNHLYRHDSGRHRGHSKRKHRGHRHNHDHD